MIEVGEKKFTVDLFVTQQKFKEFEEDYKEKYPNKEFIFDDNGNVLFCSEILEAQFKDIEYE